MTWFSQKGKQTKKSRQDVISGFVNLSESDVTNHNKSYHKQKIMKFFFQTYSLFIYLKSSWCQLHVSHKRKKFTFVKSLFLFFAGHVKHLAHENN